MAQMVFLLLLLPLLASSAAGSGKPQCKDAASCEVHMQDLIESLDLRRKNMTGKHLVLDSIEGLRNSIISGERISLPTTHRQHLEQGSPLVGAISYDAKHLPISTNVTRAMKLQRTIADDVEVSIHMVMPLKKPSGQAVGSSALLVTIDRQNRMSIHTLEGDMRLSNFDLGHGHGRTVTQLVLSPNQDNHFAMTADDQGEVRVHTLRVIARKAEPVEAWNASMEEEEEKPDEKPEEKFEKKHGIKQLVVTANFSTSFRLPPSSVTGESRKLTTVLPIDRGSTIVFVTGDSMGGVGVFHRNGTLKGRVRVTEDPGGILGLMRGQGQSVLFFSSHSFGFMSVSQVDVQYPPCTGWNSPLFDIAPDPSLSYSRVILSLSDGDVLVFSTTRGKAKACDLTLKFPHVSPIPFKLHVFRGHVIGLPTPSDTTARKEEYHRELHFFNIGEMEAGYGTAPTRVVTLQASFKPRKPHSFTVISPSGGGPGGGKAQVTLQFAGEKGVALYELNLKQPPPPKSAQGDGWLEWFPKVGVFGIAMVGVVIWNVRKMGGGGGGGGGGGMSDFDENMMKDALAKAGLGGMGGAGGLGGLGGDGGFDDDD